MCYEVAIPMRSPRLKGQGPTCFYHCISRITGGQFIFKTTGPGSEEAEHFVRLMHRLAAFGGLSILTYALMANHFHILCEVPAPRPLSDPELLDRVEGLYGPARRQAVQRVLQAESAGGELAAQVVRQSYLARMFDVSSFLKELKGGFAQWYNRRQDRFGALWAERFKSLLVEGGAALTAVALYIDLNPVRAGLCTDPKDYRYCGYGEAVGAASGWLRAGLARVLGYEPGPGAIWADVGAAYRRLLFRTGVVSSQAGQAVLEPEAARRVVEQEKGVLSWVERLGCRLRFFTYGLVLGSRGFVEGQGAWVRRPAKPVAGAEPGEVAAGWFVWRRGRAVPIEASG
jgi:putative transposase